MKVIIQVVAKDSAKAWAFLVEHSPGTALPDRTFIVSRKAAQDLRKAGIHFKEISREPGAPTDREVLSGERI